MTKKLILICQVCKEPIKGDDGTIYMQYAEVNAYPKLVADFEQKHFGNSKFRIYSGDMLIEYPEQPKWRMEHTKCDTEEDGNNYWFSTDRFDTWPAIVQWTAHLMEKDWFKHTDWSTFLYSILKTNKA